MTSAGFLSPNCERVILSGFFVNVLSCGLRASAGSSGSSILICSFAAFYQSYVSVGDVEECQTIHPVCLCNEVIVNNKRDIFLHWKRCQGNFFFLYSRMHIM